MWQEGRQAGGMASYQLYSTQEFSGHLCLRRTGKQCLVLVGGGRCKMGEETPGSWPRQVHGGCTAVVGREVARLPMCILWREWKQATRT